MAIARKDLTIELRVREIVPTMTLFAALVAVLSSMALYVDDESARKAAPGILWIAIAFSGTLGLARTWGREREEDALRAVLLSPISSGALFFGKALGALVFVLVTECVVAPLVALLLHAPLFDHLGGFALVCLLGTVGFVAAGTLFGALTAKTRARDLLLAVVLYPLVSPALLCGVVATRDLFAGASLAEVADWLRLLAIFDLITLGGGALLLGPLLSD
ncbi:MAG: heme exporter protein CcmB [Myxococcales bacterium]|nr:heme exporter protein CcmB [Myxococcales bacterium]